jgi:hypothetical protein
MGLAPQRRRDGGREPEMTPATSRRFRAVDTNEWMLLIAAIQTIAAGATVVVAYLAWRTSVRSTEATAHAARATEQATLAAEASVRAAETLTRIETERRHDELRPRVSLTFTQEPDRIPGRSDLFALLANNGDAITGRERPSGARVPQLVGTRPAEIGT